MPEGGVVHHGVVGLDTGVEDSVKRGAFKVKEGLEECDSEVVVIGDVDFSVGANDSRDKVIY